MQDLPAITLSQQAHARPVSGEELETFGKEAADLYIRGAANLTDAVVEVVKHAALSPEQVKRVAEFANTDAYLQLFKKEGSSHKVIEFDGGPADISSILKDLNDGGGGTVFDRGNDYNMPPPDVTKTAAVNRSRMGLMEPKLAQAFQVQASTALPYADPLRDSWELKEKLASAYSSLTDELDTLEGIYHDSCDNLFQEVKQASFEGTTLGQTISLWQAVTEEPEYVKLAFQMLVPRLMDNRVFLTKVAIAESIEKTASSGMPNLNHPLVVHYRVFCESLEKMASIRNVRDEVAAGIDTLQTFMKQAAVKEATSKEVLASESARALGKFMREHGKKVWTVPRDLAAHAAPAVEEALGGGTVGRVGGLATKALPYGGAAILATRAKREMDANPTLRAATDFTTANLPVVGKYTRAGQLQDARIAGYYQ